MRTRTLTTRQRSRSKVDRVPTGAADTLAAARGRLHAAEVDLRDALARGCDPSAARALVLIQLAALRLDEDSADIPAAA